MNKLLLALLAFVPLVANASLCTDPRADMSLVGGTDINLMAHDATQNFTATNGTNVIVTQVSPQPTGSGVIDPFLRVQRANSPCVAGYNTGGDAGITLDDIAGVHTHALQTSQLTTTNINGVNYVQFLLDINQTGADPLLSLEALRIFSFGSGGLDESVNGLDTLLGLQSLFNMDDGGNRRLLIDFSLNSGSGSGDVLFSVNADLFANAGPFIYLFSRFGAAGTPFENNDGYEEWALVQNACPLSGCRQVPEPGSLALLGLGLIGIGAARRKVES